MVSIYRIGSIIIQFVIDKKFAVKARLSGVLTIVVGFLKKYQDGEEKLFTILKLLCNLSMSSKDNVASAARTFFELLN